MDTRVLFVPQFYYIQYPMFKRVILDLVKQGVDARLLYIPNISELDETPLYNTKLFQRDAIPYYEFRLKRLAGKKHVNRFLQYLQYKINCCRLKKILKMMEPDGIVIGSHLGQMYIRYLQVICHKLGIPIISIWNMEIVFNERSRIPNILSTIFGVKDVLGWGCYNKYMKKHLFLTTGHALKRYMENLGIEGGQIIVSGNPVHDELSDIRLKRQSAKEDRKCVVLLTEAIQDVMGTEYLLNTLGRFKKIIESFPEYVEILIKYHPREPLDIKYIYRDIFKGPRFKFAEDYSNLVNILKCAYIAIAHYTSAIETALIVGTPCISLNTMGKDEHRFFRNEESRYLEANNVDEALQKISAYFNDRTAHHIINKACEAWLEDNVILDGNNTARVSNCITKHIEKHKRLN